MTAKQPNAESIPQVGKALVYNPEGKILTLFRSNTHPHLAHYVDFPGGEVEANEKAEVAIAREIEEETKIKIDPAKLSVVQSGTLKDSDDKGETLYYLGKVTLTNTPEATLSWEHERYEWLAADELLGQMATQTEATDTFWNYVTDYLNNSTS
jgi:8-oxo-dGTP pyrophosphatase MutT (NUDIX family)